MFYLVIDGLCEVGVFCLQVDFSSDDGILIFVEVVKLYINGLCVIIYNVSDWMVEKLGVLLSVVINCMMQIYVYVFYLFNYVLEVLLCGYGYVVSDIIYIIDYVVECGSDKYIVYVVSKVVLDNMICFFVCKLVLEVKVNVIVLLLIMFNEGDDEVYCQQVLDKLLMKIVSGEKEISDFIDYLFISCYVIGCLFVVDGGCLLCQWKWFQLRINSQVYSFQYFIVFVSVNGRCIILVKYYSDSRQIKQGRIDYMLNMMVVCRVLIFCLLVII